MPDHLPTASSDRRHGVLRAAAPLLVIAAFVVLVLYGPLVRGRALYWGDIGLYFEPLIRLMASEMRQGRIALWNPYVLCGQPVVGNPQAWTFYPGLAAAALLEPWRYITANSAAHIMLAGWGCYLFMRRLSRDRLGAVMGALAYSGGACVLQRLQFPPMAQAAAYLPWVLLMVDRVTDRPGPGYAALLALAVALEVLAGHAQVAYLTLAMAAVYAAARLWHARRHRARLWKAARWLVAALGVGIAAASAYLLPSLQLLAISTRERLTWAQANRFALTPGDLIGFLWPGYFGSPAAGTYWGDGNAWESSLYIGLVPLALAVFAAVRRSRRGSVRFFAVAALAALWLALGRYGGIYYLFFLAVPGLSSFHDPARFALLATFCLAALASVGMRALRDNRVGLPWRAGLVALAFIDLAAHGAGLNPSTDPGVFRRMPAVATLLPGVGQGRTAVTDRSLVWERYVSYHDFGSQRAGPAAEVFEALPSNTGARWGKPEAGGYEPVPVEAVTRIDGLFRAALRRRDPEMRSAAALLDAGHVLIPQGTRYAHPALEKLDAGRTEAYVSRPAPSRAWAVRATRRVDGARRALAAVADPAFDFRREAIVSGGIERVGQGLPPPQDAVTAERSDRATRLRYTVQAGEEPAFLVVSAAAYPGWRAEVDGRPARVTNANHALMGVWLGPGRHEVEFLYSPHVVRVAVYISLLAVALIACGLVAGGVGRPTPSPVSAHTSCFCGREARELSQGS